MNGKSQDKTYKRNMKDFYFSMQQSTLLETMSLWYTAEYMTAQQIRTSSSQSYYLTLQELEC